MAKGFRTRSMIAVAALLLAAPLPATATDADDPPDFATLGLATDADQAIAADLPPFAAAPVVYDMYFPIPGGATYSDNFGDPRGGGTRTHHGIDIMLPKMTPVLAVASGYVGWMHNTQGGKCCAFELNHDDGWESWYIHLNNDTPGTDDGQGWGFAPGVEPGARIEAGQLVGWVGDSGNAENSGPHLHFELHQPGGVVINPYHSLNAATVLDAPLGSGNPRGCDYNDDGYDDLAIGMPGEDKTETAGIDSGAVTVMYGTASGLSATGARYFTQATRGVDSRIGHDEEFGYATACGDINNDGFDDLVVGVPGEAVGGNADAGAINLILGSPDGLAASGSNFWHQNRNKVKNAAEPGDRFGEALAIGDFNNDGYDDVAVGAPGETVRGKAAAGLVIILYGSAAGFTGTSAAFTERTPGVSGAPEADDNFGAALAAADFDNDGRSDLAIGIPGEDIAGVIDVGAIVTLYGADTGIDTVREARFTQSTSGIAGTGRDGEQFGFALTAGDFDGDENIDLAIGVPGERVDGTPAGGVAVLYGFGSGLTTAGSQLLRQGLNGVRGTGAAGDRFGAAVSYGDFDGDGNHDLAVGAPGKQVSGLGAAGSVAVIYGSDIGLTGAADDVWTQDSNGIRGVAESEDSFGSWLVSGDYSGIGVSHLAVGIPQEDLGAKVDAGLTQVIIGRVGTGLGPAGDQHWDQGDRGMPGAPESGDGFGYIGP